MINEALSLERDRSGGTPRVDLRQARQERSSPPGRDGRVGMVSVGPWRLSARRCWSTRRPSVIAGPRADTLVGRRARLRLHQVALQAGVAGARATSRATRTLSSCRMRASAAESSTPAGSLAPLHDRVGSSQGAVSALPPFRFPTRPPNRTCPFLASGSPQDTMSDRDGDYATANFGRVVARPVPVAAHGERMLWPR